MLQWLVLLLALRAGAATGATAVYVKLCAAAGLALKASGTAVHGGTTTIAENGRGLLGRLQIYRRFRRGVRPFQAWSRCATRSRAALTVHVIRSSL